MKEENNNIEVDNKKVKDEEIDIIEIEENNNVIKENETKDNETIMKMKLNDMLDDFKENDIIIKRRNRKKTILYIIGILIEILIIIFIIKSRYINKEEYITTLKCSNTVQNIENNASIKTTNTYYFDKKNNVSKMKNSIVYVFNDKDSYNRFKSDYVSIDIKDYKGLTQESIFDDSKLAFKTETTYTYSELKKNKKVTVDDNLLILNMQDRDDPITIHIDNYDSVLVTNENMEFICE